MRIRFFLFMTAVSSVSAGLAIQACGGSSDSTGTTGGDSSTEGSAMHPDTSVVDSSLPDVFDARPPCDPNKDILKDIPDAAIPDSSATTGTCIACVESKCMMEVQNCKADCSRSTTDLGCQDLAATAISCYAQKHDFFMCAGGFVTAKSPTQGIGIALGTCVGNNCTTECGVDGGM